MELGSVTGVNASARIPQNPAVARELLWEGRSFPLKLPQTRFAIKNSEFLGHSYAYLLSNKQTDGGLVRTYLHPGMEDLREIRRRRHERPIIICSVSVWQTTRQDGTRSVHLDYVPVDVEHATKKLRVVRREEADKCPPGMGGTIISITLPKNEGFVLIGERMS